MAVEDSMRFHEVIRGYAGGAAALAEHQVG